MIEFAFAVPVLIILLFFVMDGPLAYRISMKLQKISELTAQMIYNVKGDSISKLSLNDLKNISTAVGVTLTNSKAKKGKKLDRYPFYLSTYVICVTGIGSNGFAINWHVHIQNELSSGEVSTNKDMSYSSIGSGDTSLTNTNLKNFNIQKGEVKLLIETVAWYEETEETGSKNTDENEIIYKSKTQRGFNNGYYLLTIPGKKKENGAKTFGDRFAVVSPPQRLISETDPPSWDAGVDTDGKNGE